MGEKRTQPEDLPGVLAWISGHDARIDAYWEAQHKLNEDLKLVLNEIAKDLATGRTNFALQKQSNKAILEKLDDAVSKVDVMRTALEAVGRLCGTHKAKIAALEKGASRTRAKIWEIVKLVIAAAIGVGATWAMIQAGMK